MQQNKLSINAIVMSVALGLMALGSFTATATAANVEHDSGTWVNKSKSIKGGWSIEKRGDQHVISFNDKFKTRGGPDLKVFLSPQSIENVTGKNATNGAALVAVLKSTKGSQEYVLPSNIDVSKFNSLLIHCEAFSVLWGGTNFTS